MGKKKTGITNVTAAEESSQLLHQKLQKLNKKLVVRYEDN